MDNPNDAPSAVQDTAADIFGDASNPAVEAAAAASADTGLTTEPVIAGIPAVADFKAPEGGTTHVGDAPVVPAVVAPVVPAVASVAAPVAPVATAPTAEQIALFQQWQAAQAPVQQQQFVPPTQQQAAPVQHQAQQPRPLSQPEIDQVLNRYTVPVEQFNNLFSESDPVKATAILNDILEKKVIQAVTMAHHLVQEQAAQLTQRVAPYMQFADTQREHLLREQFAAANPDLRGQDLLIQTVMGQMALERRAGTYAPQSEQQVFSDVATRTKALIAQMQQQGQTLPQTQVVAQPAVQAAGKPAMAVLPTGGGGGSSSAASGTAGAPGESQTARSIFG